MIDPSWRRQEITDFRGSWSLVEQTDIPEQGSVRSINCAFVTGSVRTRTGFTSVFNSGDIVTSMKHWLFGNASSSGISQLIWYKSGYGVRIADLSAPAPTNLYAVSNGYAAVFADAGDRFYSAHFNTSGVGVDGGKVYGYNVGSDNLFARPMLTTEVTVGASTAAGGNCSIGTRNVAFIMTTRNGYTGRPSPANTSLVVQPTSVTTTSANKQFTVTVTPTTVWPSYAAKISLIMTTTSNNARYYFIPGAVLATPAGGALPVSFTVNVSDNDLVLDPGVSDATKYFFLLTQDASNVAPFNPCSVFVAGNRMAYCFKNSNYGQGVAFSDQNNYQAISADTSLVYLPGQLEPVTGFYSQGVNYIVGPNWTFGVSDNGGDPVSWAPATQIDAAIGTRSPLGVAFDASRSVGWVAHTSGLYRFAGGRYDSLPISYFNTPDYQRIIWDQFYSVQVVDDPIAKTVMVAAPLRSSGICSTDGTTVNWVSGGTADVSGSPERFCTAWKPGQAIVINGVTYTISSVPTRTTLILTTSAGVQTNVSFSVTPTYNTHLLTWSYESGDDASRAKFSMWFTNGIQPSAIGLVESTSTKQRSTWIGPGTAGSFYRQMANTESNAYRDGSAAVDYVYDTALLPGSAGNMDTAIQLHHGATLRISGNGLVYIAMFGLDRETISVIPTINLTASPGRMYHRLGKLINEKVYYSFNGQNTLDSWFELSMLIHYYSPYAQHR